MAITGPKIQINAGKAVVAPETGMVTLDWASFFASLQNTAFNVSRSGPTASRPTNTVDGRFIGMPYFDTTLGLTVYLKSVAPDVWVNGAGVAV